MAGAVPHCRRQQLCSPLLLVLGAGALSLAFLPPAKLPFPPLNYKQPSLDPTASVAVGQGWISPVGFLPLPGSQHASLCWHLGIETPRDSSAAHLPSSSQRLRSLICPRELTHNPSSLSTGLLFPDHGMVLVFSCVVRISAWPGAGGVATAQLSSCSCPLRLNPLAALFIQGMDANLNPTWSSYTLEAQLRCF